MAGPGMRDRVRRGAARLRSVGGAKAVILAYHRVRRTEADPYLLHVTPDHFAEHLEVIRTVGTPMRLSELAGRLQSGTVPARVVCVTFDDAYDDVADVAQPLLERFAIPATVFVTTDPQGRAREFWWDELERILLGPGRIPDTLRVRVNGRVLRWEFGPSADYPEHSSWRTWTVPVNGGETKPDPTPRHTAFRELHDALLDADGQERDAVVEHLRGWAGTPESPRSTHRALEPEGVRSIERRGPIEVGVHTDRHLSLPAQSPEVRRAEISRSKATLEEWVGHPVTGFAYPYGFHCADSVAAVAEAGLTHACTTEPRAVRAHDRALALPRTAVLDCDGEQLERILRRQLGRSESHGRR